MRLGLFWCKRPGNVVLDEREELVFREFFQAWRCSARQEPQGSPASAQQPAVSELWFPAAMWIFHIFSL